MPSLYQSDFPTITRCLARMAHFLRFSKAFGDGKKSVSAISYHDPPSTITAQTLEGRDVHLADKSIAVDLKNAGGNFHDKEVVVCQNQVRRKHIMTGHPSVLLNSIYCNIVNDSY